MLQRVFPQLLVVILVLGGTKQGLIKQRLNSLQWCGDVTKMHTDAVWSFFLLQLWAYLLLFRFRKQLVRLVLLPWASGSKWWLSRPRCYFIHEAPPRLSLDTETDLMLIHGCISQGH